MQTTIVRRTRRIVMRMMIATTTQMQNCRESWIACAESERRGRRKRYVCALILYRVCLANTHHRKQRDSKKRKKPENEILLLETLFSTSKTST